MITELITQGTSESGTSMWCIIFFPMTFTMFFLPVCIINTDRMRRTQCIVRQWHTSTSFPKSGILCACIMHRKCNATIWAENCTHRSATTDIWLLNFCSFRLSLFQIGKHRSHIHRSVLLSHSLARVTSFAVLRHTSFNPGPKKLYIYIYIWFLYLEN